MIRLASVINTFAADFLAHYRDRLKPEHYRALTVMQQCRTQASRKMQAHCTSCDHQVLIPHSCGHRHCPHCQHHESQQWLERQMRKRVPAEYFLLTFTLGRYLYRGVIREQDILACNNGVVCFAYRDGKTGKMQRRTLPGAQFLWLVLQHVLPKDRKSVV